MNRSGWLRPDPNPSVGENETDMVKDIKQTPTGPGNEGVISIIGPGMKVVGDVEAEGTLRIEGVIEGKVHAGKAVVVGKDGQVHGDILTQDAVIGGHVEGSILADSRLELQATCVVDGEIRARRLKLDEGGRVTGQVRVGEVGPAPTVHTPKPVPEHAVNPSKSGKPDFSPQHVDKT